MKNIYQRISFAMNNEWKEFLHTQKAVFDSEFDVSFPGQHDSLSVETIHPLAYLSVLEVAGSDAQKFLQGQTTCNFDQIDTERGALGAFCSAKGRVISSFIAVKHDAGFLLILPADLIETVKKRLQFYVLRAAVNLTVLSDSFTVLGINTQNRLASNLPEANFHAAPLGEKGVILKWPSVKHRFLMVAPFEEARRFWLDVQTAHGVKPSSTRAWQLCEFVDGIPWLNRRTTEQYIPQWLNLDILGGIHFNKGCYTGQEIIA
ncbi:MAG: CAF17-like 4Fe-4S cluster assembly/insertion protein YgfZ, partial [Gammaproteobacteria bacterium]